MTSPLHSIARRGTVIVASLATAALALSVSPASAAEAGHISGTVDFADSALMDDDTYAYAYQYNPAEEVEDWEEVGQALVQLDGTYDIPALDAGTYHVGFENIGGGYLTEYFEDSATVEGGDPVAVAATGTTPDVNATLAVAGHIAGTVTDDLGDPIADIQVAAEDELGDRAGTAFTDENGDYDLGGLRDGDYVLEFSDYEDLAYVAEFYDDAATRSAAEPVTLAAGATEDGIDAELATASQIEGTVSGVSGPLEFASVSVYTQVDGEWDYLNYQGDGAFTDEFGHYNLAGLAAGDYRLEFYADGFISEFYENAATVDAGDTVELAYADSETADAYLDLPSSITGTMTTAAGTPAVGGDVTVSGGTAEDPEYIDTVQTDEDGNWVVEDMAAGSYIVDFGYDAGDKYLFEYWNDATEIEDATPVVVEGDASVTDEIDAVMDDKFPVVPQVNNLAMPTVSGTPQVGSTLSANPGTWDRPDATFTYYWETYKEGQEHTDFLANGRTFVPTAAIVGQRIWVTVVASAPGIEDGYATSDDVGPVTAAPVVVPPVVVPPVVTPPLTDVDNTHKPKVQGAKKVGSTLKAKVASWIPAGATVKYQWLVNGKPIKKATKAKLKLTNKLKGKKVSVKVIATSAGSLPVTVVTKVGKIKP